MGIKFNNIAKHSELKRVSIDVQLGNSAGSDLSAGYTGQFIAPYNCSLREVKFINSVALSASNGISVGVSNTTKASTLLAGAGNGKFGSGTNMWSANKYVSLTPSATHISANSLINVTISASVGAGPIAVTCVIVPAAGVR